MRLFSKIVEVVYILLGVIFIFLLLSFFANEEILKIFFEFLKANIFRVGVVSSIILLLGIIYVVNYLDYTYRTKSISFDNPGGKVKISLKAIEDYITSTISKRIEGIKTIKVKSFVTNKGLETKITLKIFSNLNIPEVCNNIQELTKRYLQDTIGIERIANIEIYVSNIIGESENEPERET